MSPGGVGVTLQQGRSGQHCLPCRDFTCRLPEHVSGCANSNLLSFVAFFLLFFFFILFPRKGMGSHWCGREES